MAGAVGWGWGDLPRLRSLEAPQPNFPMDIWRPGDQPFVRHGSSQMGTKVSHTCQARAERGCRLLAKNCAARSHSHTEVLQGQGHFHCPSWAHAREAAVWGGDGGRWGALGTYVLSFYPHIGPQLL